MTKRDLEGTPVQSINTETGSIRVSTPEATALDLFRYLPVAGDLGNVATVLAELAERLDPERLVEVASGARDVSTRSVWDTCSSRSRGAMLLRRWRSGRLRRDHGSSRCGLGGGRGARQETRAGASS